MEFRFVMDATAVRLLSTSGPLWTAVRGVGNSSAVRLTIFIPVIGYAIIFNENIVQYLNLSKDIFAGKNIFGRDDVFSTQSAISWRLLSLYFGLCLVAMASLVYAVRCPGLIKNYASATEFVGAVREHTARFVMDQIHEELARSPFGAQYNAVMLDHKSYVQNADHPDNLTEIHQDTSKEVLSLYFLANNVSFPGSRAAVIAFYIVGFSAVALPSLDVFTRVCRLLFQTLLLIA